MSLKIKESLQSAYLDWVNNYLSIEKYAEHNRVTTDCALKIIEAGRHAHESIVNELKLKEAE